MVNTRLTLPLTWINFGLRTALPLNQCEKVLCIQVCVRKNLVQFRYRHEELPRLT